MGARLRHVLPAWSGVVLMVVGVLVFVASYCLLPVSVTQCEDACGWYHTTTWQYALGTVSVWNYWVNALPHFDILLVTATVLLALYYLPLLAAVTVVGCSVAYLVHPHRALATWGHRTWLMGSVAFVLLLAWLLFAAGYSGGGPAIGFLGLLVGYGVLWAGNRVFLTPQP